MRVLARLGRAMAIAWLLLLYVPLGVVFHGTPSTLTVVGTLLSMGVFIAVYVAYWLRWFRYPSLRVTTIFVVALMILGLLINVASNTWSINPFVFPIVIAGYAYPVRLAIVSVLGLSLVAMVLVQPALFAVRLPAIDDVVLELLGALQLLLFGFGAIGIARLVGTIRELQLAREQLARLAVEQERTRFARDVHDLMGHSLSVITLKGELASQLIESAPQQALDEVRDIVKVARNALREVRETVSGYRQPTLASEIAGAQAALAAAGIECTIEQSAGALTSETEAVLAWTVREGATNVIRHSKAHRCSIVLKRDDDFVRLDIVDDGPSSAVPQVGNGLRGLGERVRDQNGRLEAEPLPHQGFRLRVVLPTDKSKVPTDATEAAEIGE